MKAGMMRSNLHAVDGEQALAIAVIEQARFDLGARKFLAWLRSDAGHLWMTLAAVKNPADFVSYVQRRMR